MAFTYDLGTNIGKVRFWVPDNNSSSYLLQDDEITYVLGLVGNNVIAAAADLCDQMARYFAQQATFSADGLSVQNHARAESFAARAKELRERQKESYTSVSVTRDDGYHTEAQTQTTEYGGRVVYIRTR